jgi:hypothetical protein
MMPQCSPNILISTRDTIVFTVPLRSRDILLSITTTILYRRLCGPQTLYTSYTTTCPRYHCVPLTCYCTPVTQHLVHSVRPTTTEAINTLLGSQNMSGRLQN